MRQKIVGGGKYELGDEFVQIVLREGDGAEFWLCPGDIPYPRIKVGADQDNWRDVVANLKHEAEELTMVRLRLRYYPGSSYAADHGSYLFAFNHSQFCELSARVAYFLVDCLPDLAKAWAKWKKEK
jgi:hypothetical protein